MSWTEDRVAELKKLWNQGLSASQIAARMPGATRNAVLSKIHRLGCAIRGDAPRKTSPRQYQRRALPTVQRPPRPKPAAAVLASTPEPYVEPHEELDIPIAERKSLFDLTETSCRWPIGDPRHADFHFCNRTKVAGLPYCEHHARRAYQPAQVRRAPSAPASTPKHTPVAETVDA